MHVLPFPGVKKSYTFFDIFPICFFYIFYPFFFFLMPIKISLKNRRLPFFQRILAPHIPRQYRVCFVFLLRLGLPQPPPTPTPNGAFLRFLPPFLGCFVFAVFVWFWWFSFSTSTVSPGQGSKASPWDRFFFFFFFGQAVTSRCIDWVPSCSHV